MPETEIIKFVVQMGMGGVFFWLYWDTKKQLWEQDAKHDADIKQLYEMRVQELKLIARLPTDLEANYTMPAKSA